MFQKIIDHFWFENKTLKQIVKNKIFDIYIKLYFVLNNLINCDSGFYKR